MDSTRYELRLLADDDELTGLQDAWNDLALRCGESGLACDHVLAVQSWRRHRADPGKSLHVITIRRDGALVFVMPLIRKRGPLGTSRLDWLDSMTPLYDGILVDPDTGPGPICGLVRAHLGSLRGCRRLKVRFVPAGSLLERLLIGLGAAAEPHMTAYAMNLSGYRDWDDFLAAQSPNLRQKYRNSLRKLEAVGYTGLQRISDDTQMREQIAWIFAGKRQWVIDRFGRENWISPPETEAFFQASAAGLASQGRACVARLACNGETAASTLLFRSGDTLHLSKQRYAHQWRKHSPGWMLVLETIRAALRDGIRRVDFMTGEEEWKYRLASEETAIMTYRLPLRPLRQTTAGELRAPDPAAPRQKQMAMPEA